ncbi:MAG: thioredoxin-related protein [Paracoccaceae bacterium]|jgi:thioredoxin-related protein
MKGSFLLLCGTALLVTSCAELMKVPLIRPKASKKSKFTDGSGGGGIGGNPHAKLNQPNEDMAVSEEAPVESGFLPARVGEGVTVGGMELIPDHLIVWSSGDDPNADIPFKKAFLNKPSKKTPWMPSYSEARRESMRSGKPILMWFTRTGSPASPMCVTLSRELLATHEFAKWAKENVIRLKIDVSGGVDNKTRRKGDEVTRRNYAEKLKKQYHVMGYPTLIVLQPDGGVYSRERGYSRGENKEIWGNLKNAALTIEHNRGVYERRMAKKGYRVWIGQDRGLVFAKLSRFDEKSGTVWLTEPDGNLIKTSTRYLSNDDRGWIIAEKARRGH